jgi:phosphoribosylformylglycinamidine cyclo-ligase
VNTILDVINRFDIRGIVNVTGGGITGNVPRIIPKGLSVEVDRSKWHPPAIFAALQEWGDVADDEMFRVFNMGIGMIVIVPAKQADDTILHLMHSMMNASVIGRVVKGDGRVIYL